MLRAQADAVVRELHDGIAAARSRVEAFAAEQLDGVIGALSAEVDAARAEARSLRLQLDAAETDKRNAITEMKKQRDRANDFEKQVRKERDRRAHAEDRLNGHGVHDDPEAQLRHKVSVAR
jgi:chromosome segregation ATPase